MKNIIQRSITGAIFVGIIVFSILFNQYSFFVIFGILHLLCLFEFYKIIKSTTTKPLVYSGLIIGETIFIINFLINNNNIGSKYYLLLFPLVFVVFLIELFRKNDFPIKDIAYTLMGLLYITIPFSLMINVLFINSQYSSIYLLSFFVLVWSNDTFAFLSGITLGKHKLFERISPKKTWEGFLGGIIFTILIAFFFIAPNTQLDPKHLIVISILISIFGTLGDLIESMIKRSLQIKDSGTFLPGHGGFLDRFDAVVFALPTFFAYLYFILI